MAQLSPEERKALASNAAKERWRMARERPPKSPGTLPEVLERIAVIERELSALKKAFLEMGK